MKTTMINKIKNCNGIFTIQNKKTGEHRTFKIRTVLKGDMKGRRIISLLVGQDNENDFMSFGFVDGYLEPRVKVWKKFEQQKSFVSFGKMVEALIFKIPSNLKIDTYSIQESLHCFRCNRLLTTPESIESGYGAECIKKI